MKICIAGSNDIAVNSLSYIINKNIFRKDEIGVICNRGDIGVNTWQLSLKKFAHENQIKIVSLEDGYLTEGLIFLSLHFDKIIKPANFITKQLFNLHFAQLPKYKGNYTSIIPILNGEKETGVTLHYIDEGIDTGDIIIQKRFPIEINETAKDLYEKYNKYGLDLITEFFTLLLSESLKSIPQTSIDSTYYSRKSINFSNFSINYKKTSFEIHNQIRAFIFKEYQLPVINGFRIVKSIITDEKIERNYFKELNDSFIISGIDCYKLIAYKE